MDARARFINSLAKFVNDAYYAEGFPWISVEQISAIAEEAQLPDHEATAVLALLDQRGLLERQEGGHSYSNGLGLALRYEEADRPFFWGHNKLRREILRRAAESEELTYNEGAEQFIDAPWAEVYAASQTLEYLGLVEMRAAMGHNFWVSISAEGYELQRDTRALARALPVSAAEDEDAVANIAPDAMGDLIVGVEDLLKKRGWTGAMRELERGDDQYRDGHWTDAVREYYAALESGLKHRLDEAPVEYADGAALKDLAKIAATHDLIPTNCQALFGFADSIRSPRSHGAGANVIEVEVGKAEALLMGNHVRALMLYLGHRPG
jgi:hypothetical protein